MKRLILLFTYVLLILISCKKEEYIKHDSPIFLNNNQQIVGTWVYLYTIRGGGYINMQMKTFQDLPDLKIDPNGDYEKFKDNKILSWGVIDTIKTVPVLYVKFYPNGIKKYIDVTPSLIVDNSDTLLVTLGSGETYSSEYYKRK